MRASILELDHLGLNTLLPQVSYLTIPCLSPLTCKVGVGSNA